VTASVDEVLDRLAVTRLAHFTPARNLWHIAQDGCIRSSKDLADHAPDYFDPTDHERFDRHPEMVCTSFEYPNVYYLAHARVKPQYTNYPDWVCLLLNRDLVRRPGSLFCDCNAAKHSGAHLREGADALLGCFADVSPTAGWHRSSNQLAGSATDLQAEALIPGPIDLSDVLGIVVPSADDALNQYGILALGNLGPERFGWVVSPVLFSTSRLVSAIKNGHDIEEYVWRPPIGLGAR
jgi:hypothetical protein